MFSQTEQNIWTKIKVLSFFLATYLLFFFVLPVAAQEQSTPPKTLLLHHATELDVQLNLSPNLELDTNLEVPKSFRDKKAYLDWIAEVFPNYIITETVQSSNVIILPEGITATVYKELEHLAAQPTPNQNLQNKKNQIPAPELLKQPEISQLVSYAKAQKNHSLHYKRLVGDIDHARIYDFRVRYIEGINRMMPYEKAGKSAVREMEGFTNFYTIYESIEKHVDNLYGYRDASGLHLFLNDDETNIVKLNNLDGQLAVSIVSKDKTPIVPFQIHLQGTDKESTIRTEIHHPIQKIIFNDLVTQQ